MRDDDRTEYIKKLEAEINAKLNAALPEMVKNEPKLAEALREPEEGQNESDPRPPRRSPSRTVRRRA